MASVGVNTETVESRVPVLIAFGIFRRIYGMNRSISPVKLLVEMSVMFFLEILIGNLKSFGFLEKWPFLIHQHETLGEVAVQYIENVDANPPLKCLCQMFNAKIKRG